MTVMAPLQTPCWAPQVLPTCSCKWFALLSVKRRTVVFLVSQVYSTGQLQEGDMSKENRREGGDLCYPCGSASILGH